MKEQQHKQITENQMNLNLAGIQNQNRKTENHFESFTSVGDETHHIGTEVFKHGAQITAAIHSKSTG